MSRSATAGLLIKKQLVHGGKIKDCYCSGLKTSQSKLQVARFALLLINLVAPPYFLYFFQSASLAPFLFISFKFVSTNLVGSLPSPLDLCNVPILRDTSWAPVGGNRDAYLLCRQKKSKKNSRQ